MLMATADRYSRLVFWMKVALPLAALAILSTLFFVAETLDPEAAIPYAEVDVARILRDQGITAPAFGGVTAGGVTVSLKADAIRPDENDRDRWTATALRLVLEQDDGTDVLIESPEGTIDSARQTAELAGGARLTSSTGYVITTSSIVASIEDATVFANAGVQASGPAGMISAGKVMLRRIDTEPLNHHLVFQDGVRLIIQPPR
jgi:lipopolysaccharide export system protein LptC